MFNHLPDAELDRFLDEDIPYGDLTTSLLGIGEQPATITFTCRENSIVCCTEEAARILERCGASVHACLKSGSSVLNGTTILSAHGSAAALHAGWKVALNLLEYASGIATRTGEIVEKVKAINPNIAVVATRKSFPGTKKVAVKAIMAGGALPHRLGLSESILLFRQHTSFLGGLDAALQMLPELKRNVPEQKIMVEVESAEEALKVALAGTDVVQLDKMTPEALAQVVPQLRAQSQTLKISAAGGINAQNAVAYAQSGVDILVLSSLYFGKPADIGVSIVPTTTSP